MHYKNAVGGPAKMFISGQTSNVTGMARVDKNRPLKLIVGDSDVDVRSFL